MKSRPSPYSESHFVDQLAERERILGYESVVLPEVDSVILLDCATGVFDFFNGHVDSFLPDNPGQDSTNVLGSSSAVNNTTAFDKRTQC